MKARYLTLLFVFAACTNPSETRRTLRDAGYENVKTHGHAAFACGEKDVTSTRFTADNPRGRRVRGVVCCGWAKGCTIRH